MFKEKLGDCIGNDIIDPFYYFYLYSIYLDENDYRTVFRKKKNLNLVALICFDLKRT